MNPATAEGDNIDVARQRLDEGRLVDAEWVCRRVLATSASEAGAWHLLGLVAYRRGDVPGAVAMFQKAASIRPGNASYHNDLSAALNDAGDHDDAEAAARRALGIDPGHPDAHVNLGNALRAQGRLNEAEQAYGRAIDGAPAHLLAWNNLGGLLRMMRRHGAAEAAYRRALEIGPGNPTVLSNLASVLLDAQRPAEAEEAATLALLTNPASTEAAYNLGVALQAQARHAEAEAAYRRVLQIVPGHWLAMNNLAGVLRALRRPTEAAEIYRRALVAHPGMAAAAVNLGSVLLSLGASEEAEEACRRAIDVAPTLPEAHLHLSVALRLQGRPVAAEQAARESLRLQPHGAAAEYALAEALRAQGRLEESIPALERSLAADADPAVHSSLVYALHFHPASTPEDLLLAHISWDQRHAADDRAALTKFRNVRGPERPIRLGFVAPHFRRHPVAYFTIRTIEAIDHDRFCVVCYSDATAGDDMTSRFVKSADLWRNSWGLSDQELAARVREDEVDVLFDLCGHTGGNRMMAFARRAAPLQVTWAGYMGTTGLAAMDYAIVDQFVAPSGADTNWAESLIRLPDSFMCYDPAPEVAADVPRAGSPPTQTTFCCFNQPVKYNDLVLRTWARLLARVPRARLLLKYSGLDERGCAERMATRFRVAGGAAEQLQFEGSSPRAELMASYLRAAVSLDPFPFTGSTTTLESLWMGVPVITCPGETFASRQSLSYLSTIGLTETIAKDLDEYVEIAVSLANDLDRLGEFRRTLRERMASSPLCDGPRFARNFMTAIRAIWRNWCANADENGFLPPEKRPVEIDWGLAEPPRAGQDERGRRSKSRPREEL